MTYEVRQTAITINRAAEPLFSELATRVEIEIESSGEFVQVSQTRGDEFGKIEITPEEWPALREAIDQMIALCRGAK